MKKHTALFFAVFLFASQFLHAQLTSQKKSYTLADTLRGALRPERTCFDVTFYDLKVKFDTTEKTITGSNRIVFRTVEDFQTMQIDLFENLTITRITSGGKELKFRREFNAVFINMNEPMKAGTEGELTVNYNGKPVIGKRPPWDGGFTWAKDKNKNKWISVSCEGLGASAWWPCKDHLGDEPDSMRMSFTFPADMKCVSNGNEESSVTNADSTITSVWKVSYPINNYNVTFYIGDYVSFHDEYVAEDGEKLSLDYYVLSYNIEKAKKHFEVVKPMLKCYEKFLGKYPFPKDGFSLVEAPYLGMEHQGAIAYGNRYLTGYSGMDFSGIGLLFDYIIIHETAHEWWGNSVSCNDIADMWIHEGFTTYSEAIYVECLYGKETALKYINAKKTQIGNEEPIVGKYDVNEEGNGDMYSKGSLFLNTIRHIVNDDKLWWSVFKGMCDTTFKMKNIGYQDVVNYFNQKTGKDLTAVFEQYLKHPDLPVFEYKLKKLKKGDYELTCRWDTDVSGFKMPVVISDRENTNFYVDCSNEFQTTKIRMKKVTDFKVNEDWMYIKTREVF